ncbi:Hypothetical predicted protein [Cloeon dipterum]|uniref:Ion transport domain-containing protein n=1 Tax=Cloeon dipterum TaxID=197152 RepID=A0A8S1D6K2_9INSE|nr:Hypothetical predicted protein [Cloeon dipterum]
MSQQDERPRGGSRPPLTRSFAVNVDHLTPARLVNPSQVYPENTQQNNINNQIKWATELQPRKHEQIGADSGLNSVWHGLHTLWANSTSTAEAKDENMPISQQNSWIRRGVRRLLFRQNAQQRYDEEALQEMLRAKTNAVTNSDSKYTGEVCLLQDSPFRIIRAAESGNVEEFSRLFFADPNRINVRDSKGRTATHQAAARNQVRILQFVASNHTDLNMTDNAGNTPLHVAVENMALDAVDFLLANGADASILNSKNQAPIHLATVLNLGNVLETMSRNRDKFDVQQGGEHGRTALHIAAIHDFDECARILITQFGAVPRKPCNNGYYPIHEAAKNASSKTMEVFLQWGEARGCSREEMISFFDSEGNVPLHSAVHGGDIKAVELCLRSGAKISTQQHDLSTPVHLACAQGATEIVRLMFKMQPAEKGQCLSSCDVQKMTPLHCAAMFDHPEIVEFLIEEGADMNVVDKERRSPLLLAASKSGWRTVKTLTQFGANIHLKDSSLRNVLHLIVMNGGNLEEFASLVCRSQSQHQFEQLLNERDMVGCSPLHYASREGQIRSLQNLLTLGACVSIKNNRNESPLHFAARFGRFNTIKELLDSDKGAFIINESDGDGLTPLHIASQQGHTRVVQLLLGRGALLHRDHLGRTPLHLAAANGYTQTMELLHSVHSHLLDQADKDGNTALHMATMENRPNAISLLLSLGCKLLYNNSELSAIDYAIYYKFPEAALTMVTHPDRAQEVMSLKSDKHPCVILALIASMPKVFEAVQDRCITKANCKKDSKSFYLRYSFSCLQCSYVNDEDQKSREMMSGAKQNPLPALNAMVAHGRVELLAHPLSQKYLQMKWNSYGKYFHLANLLLYTIFLTFVTSFVTKLMSRPFPFTPGDGDDSNFTLPSLEPQSEGRGLDEEDTTMIICGTSILVYIAINVVREGMQIYQQRLHYLLDPFNIVSWMLYISAVAMVLPVFNSDLERIQYSSASITAFLAWFNLLLYLQRFDQVGIYVVMFLEILQTLIKVLFVFSILIIAFGLSLYILLSRGNHQAFESVPMSLMRTFAMMLGEIDFLNTYVHSYNQKGDGNRTLPFPTVTFVILGIFMVFMPILLMNLLIGLAVGDIESVRRNAQLKRLAMQVILHSELERKLPQMLLEKVDKIEVIEYPNDSKCKRNFLDRIFRQWFFNPFIDEVGVNNESRNEYDLSGAPPDRTMKHLKKNLQSEIIDDDVLEELEAQRRLLKDVMAKLDSQQYLLRLVLQKMEIKTEADDIDEGVSPRVFKNDGTLARWTSPRFNKKYRMFSQGRSYD